MKTISIWIKQADAALRRAGQRSRELAERTNTPLLVRRDGKVVKLFPGLDSVKMKPESAPELALREEPPACGKAD